MVMRLASVLLAGVALLGLAACERDEPATRAGAALDRAGTATGSAVGRAGEATGNAIDHAGTYVKDKTE